MDDDEDDYDGEDDSDEDEDEWADEKDGTKTTATDERPLEPSSFPSSEAWPFNSTTTATMTTTTSRQTQTEASSVQLQTTSISRMSHSPTTKKPPTPTRDGSGKSLDREPSRIGHFPFFGDLKPGMLACKCCFRTIYNK